MSTLAVYQPRSAKQEHKRRSCISPARYSCISTAIRNKTETIPGPNIRLDQGGISTAKAVYQQQSKTKAKALLVDTFVSTWAVPQPRTAKRKHLWRGCISPAPYSCISTAIRKNKLSGSASGRHRGINQDGISTARAACQQQSKLKRKHFWSTQPCQPGRCINYNQQSKFISGAAVYHQFGITVYQQQ